MGTAERKDQNIETYPRCCLCHRRPTPLAQHYYENIWNYSSAYLWKIYPCIVSRIAKPNNVCQLRIDGERVERARRKRDRGIDEDLSLSLSLYLSLCWRFRVISTHAAFRYPVAEKYSEHLHESSSMDRLEMSVSMRASSAIIFHEVVSCFYYRK